MKTITSCIAIAAAVSTTQTIFAQCQPAPLPGMGAAGPANWQKAVLHDPGTGPTFFMIRHDSDSQMRIARFDGSQWITEPGIEFNYVSDIESLGDELWVMGNVSDATSSNSAILILQNGRWHRTLIPSQPLARLCKVGETNFATRVREDEANNGYAELVRWTGSSFVTASDPFPLSAFSLISTPHGIVAAGYPIGNRTSNPGLVRFATDGSGTWSSLGTELARRDGYGGMTRAAYHNGSLYISGNFQLLSGVRGPVARLRADGTWESVNTGLSGDSVTLLPLDGQLFAAQTDSIFQQNVPTLMRLNGNTWEPALPGSASHFSCFAFAPQGYLSSIGRYQGRLAAIGSFNQAGTTPASGIATFDSSTQQWSPLMQGTAGTVTSLSRWQDRTVAVGSFHGLESDVANGLGIRNDSNSGWENPVQTLTLKPVLSAQPFSKPGTFRGDLIIAGEFSAINGIAANSIARYDGSTFHSLGQGLTTPRTNVQWAGVRGTLEWNNQLIAYGAFTHADGIDTGPIASFDGTRWNSLNAQPIHRNWGEAAIVAVAEDRGGLIVIGDFTHIAGIPAPGAARYDGSTWHALPPAFPTGYLYSWSTDPEFVRFGDRLILSLDGFDFNPDINPVMLEFVNDTWAPVAAPGSRFAITYHIFTFQGRLYASVAEEGGVTSLRTLDGTSWRNVNTGLDNPITDSTIEGDTLVVCGYFTRTAAGPSHTLARFRCLCPADFNGDQAVDMLDYLDFLSAFAAGDITSDHNSDGTVDFFDYLDFVASFASGC
jgi:hypothetical protein